MIKLQLTVLNQGTPPERLPKVTLEEKVQKAIDYIECGYKVQEALTFLRELDSMLQQQRKQTPRMERLRADIKPVLDNYGTYHLGSEDPDNG